MRVGSLVRNKSFAGYMFILPSTCVLLLFVIMPLIASFFSSFFNFDIMLKNFEFIGLENYRMVLGDERFWSSMKNTFSFTIIYVPIQTVLSLLTAVALKQTTRFSVFLRTIYFLPVVCSMTIIALALGMMFEFNIGIIPATMRTLGLPVIDVLNDTTWAMPTIILISIYKSFGFNMVILIAALQGVPESLYEASDIDGATTSDKFYNITLPSIAPTIAFAAITTTIASFQVFDQVYVTTKGGPMYTTETAVQFIYQRAFVTSEMGLATANAFLLFVVILLATLVSLRMSRRSEENF